MYDEADLFLDAQNSVWDAVTSELNAGRKTSHWMWFVFPQLASLGQSHMSQLYGLHDLQEAADYLSDPELRGRLEQVAKILMQHHDQSAAQILGDVDARKLQSSMTLFSHVPGASPVFGDVLGVFFGGEPCARTVDAIHAK